MCYDGANGTTFKEQVELYTKIRDGYATDKEKLIYESVKKMSCLSEPLYEDMIKNSPYYKERD